MVCPVGGEAPRAALPAGVPAGGGGPRGQVLPALGMGAELLVQRTPQGVLDALGGRTADGGATLTPPPRQGRD